MSQILLYTEWFIVASENLCFEKEPKRAKGRFCLSYEDGMMQIVCMVPIIIRLPLIKLDSYYEEDWKRKLDKETLNPRCCNDHHGLFNDLASSTAETPEKRLQKQFSLLKMLLVKFNLV